MLSERVKITLAFTAVYVVWGSTFFGVSLALQSFPPFLLCGLRFLIGGLTLLVYCYARNEGMPAKKEIVYLALWGIVLFGGGVVAVVWAQQYLPSSLASVIITTPFWFALLDKSQRQNNLRNGWILAGLLAGLTGVILLLTQRQSAKFAPLSVAQTRAVLVIIAGSSLWVTGSLRLRTTHYKTSVSAKTTVHLLAASAFAFLMSIGSNEYASVQTKELRTDAVIALLFLSLVSTTATFLAFIWLIKKKPVTVVSTYAYVNPLVAVLLGVFIGKESVTGLQVMAMFTILTGVLFVNIPNYKP